MSVDELTDAVASQQPTRLTKVPGIGKKTAERLLLELKDRLAPHARAPASPTAGGGAHHADILQALQALGYSDKEAAEIGRAHV